MRASRVILCCLILCLALTGCGDGSNYAPVTEVNTIDPIPSSAKHQVVAGETLYSIAWRYGLDYRHLAKRNHIDVPYTLHPGEQLALANDPIERDETPLPPSAAPVKVLPAPLPVGSGTRAWVWPARGKLLKTFSSMNKGINISGSLGAPVVAAANGKVVYCGNGLRGYGNLIILKHNNQFFSAYAHNDQMLVKEGQAVKQGQKIAEMGHSGSDRTMLHFEIRKAGKPVDPIALLRS